MEPTHQLALMQCYVRHYDNYREARAEIIKSGGEIVKDWRETTGLSVRKFALLIGISPAVLSKVERGLEPLPPEVARRILEMHR